VQLYTFRVLKQGRRTRATSANMRIKRGGRQPLRLSRRRAQLPILQLAYRQFCLLYDRSGTTEGSCGKRNLPWNVRNSRWQQLAAWAAYRQLCGCLGLLSGFRIESRKTAAVATNSQPRLFAHSARSMSHVQVLTVPAHDADSIPPADRGCGPNNSFRTTPVIHPVSGPVSRVVVVPGQKVTQGQPML